MFTRFAGLFFREEEPNLLVITSHSSERSFEIRLRLNVDNIVFHDMKKNKTIPVNKGCQVFITSSQGITRGQNPITSSEIYIKNGDELQLLCSFVVFEELNDLRKTGCYKLAVHIANILKNKYGVEWEYKICIDTPKKQKEFNLGILLMILIWIITFSAIYLQAKHS